MEKLYYTLIIVLLIAGYQLIKRAFRKRTPLSKVKRLKQQMKRVLKEVPDKARGNPILAYVSNNIYQKHMQEELYESILQLKNLATNENIYLGTAHMLELLMRFSHHLKKPYASVLSRVREGQKEKQIKTYFKSQVTSYKSEDFISILLKLDHLEPKEQKQQIIALQEAMQQERMTAKEHEQKLKSDVAYFFIVACFSLTGLNFLLVALWPKIILM